MLTLFNHSRLDSQHNWGGPMWSPVHCQWTLIIHINSRLAPELSGIDPGFFRYI